MVLINKFTVLPTSTFKEEFQNIMYYLTYKLTEPIIANKLYNKVIEAIYSLQYLPERYTKISASTNKRRNLRKLLINNYIIVYEINKDTRSSFYFTYFSL